MKKTIKVFAAIMLITALVFSIASCGAIDKSKVQGDWHATSVNGMSVADYAATLNTVEAGAMRTFNINDLTISQSMVKDIEGNLDTATGTIEMAKDGFIAKIGGYDIGYVLDEKAGTITVKFKQGDVDYTYVYEKGAYDLTAKFLEQFAALNGGAQEEAPAEEGGEENYEDYGEENYEE